MNRPYHILSIGTCYLDLNSWDYDLPEGIKWETVIENQTYELTPGGSAVNFVKLLAHSGLKPIFIGKTGTDITGRLLAEKMQEAGIEPALTTDPNVATNMSFNMSAITGRTIMLELGNANQSLTAQEVLTKTSELMEQTEYLYLGGCLKLRNLIPVYPQLIERAHQHGVKVIIDHGKATNKTTQQDIDLIQATIKTLNEDDYYIPSDTDVFNIWQVDHIEAAVEKLRLQTKVPIIITEAEKGAYIIQNGLKEIVPAYSVTVKNSVGAGDSFNAGFIKSRIEGKDFIESVKYANAFAAIKISQEGLPDLSLVEKLYQP